MTCGDSLFINLQEQLKVERNQKNIANSRQIIILLRNLDIYRCINFVSIQM